MVMGELAEQFDVAVLGAGPGGYVAAIRAAQLGKRVVVIDPKGLRALGGTCLHAGCIPSKAIIHAADEAGPKPSTDLRKVQAWKNQVVNKLTEGLTGLFREQGIEVIQGKAYFQSSNRIGIEGGSLEVHAVEFKKAVIGTGGAPIEIPGLKFDGKDIISSTEALELEAVPAELVVVGGGYIGVELGTAFAKFGSKVAIVEFAGRLLPGLDADLVAVVEQKLKALGVQVLVNAKATGAERSGGRLSVKIESKEKGALSLPADKVLVAVGRKTDAKALKLETTKVQLDERGLIKIDAQCRTTDSNIFAVGDVTPGPALAHKAYKQGKVAAEAMLGQKAAFDNRCIPLVVFSEPEIAVAGLGEEEARKAGKQLLVGKFPYNASGRALSVDKPVGFVKVIGDAKTHGLLGVGIVGAEASNLISEASLAIECGLLLEDVAETIHPHPTLSEMIAEACEQALGKCVHLPFKKGLQK